MLCPRSGPSLQAQEHRLQFSRRQVSHRRDWLDAIASHCFPHRILSLAFEQTLRDLKWYHSTNVEVRRVDLANWAIRTTPKCTTGVKYHFHKGFWPGQRSVNLNHPSPHIYINSDYTVRRHLSCPSSKVQLGIPTHYLPNPSKCPPPLRFIWSSFSLFSDGLQSYKFFYHRSGIFKKFLDHCNRHLSISVNYIYCCMHFRSNLFILACYNQEMLHSFVNNLQSWVSFLYLHSMCNLFHISKQIPPYSSYVFFATSPIIICPRI